MALLDDIRRVEARALANGALLTLQSETATADENGLPYEISWVSTQSAKDIAAVMAKSAGQTGFNPFLPHEDDLFVCNLSDSHKLLLNKFQMAQGHVLAVTRDFQEQQALLSRQDAEAMMQLFRAADGLVMFNGGREAGGSQDHRHLHFLPDGRTPLDALFTQAAMSGQVTCFDRFAFRHVLVGLPSAWQDQDDAAQQVMEWLTKAYATCAIHQSGG